MANPLDKKWVYSPIFVYPRFAAFIIAVCFSKITNCFFPSKSGIYWSAYSTIKGDETKEGLWDGNAENSYHLCQAPHATIQYAVAIENEVGVCYAAKFEILESEGIGFDHAKIITEVLIYLREELFRSNLGFWLSFVKAR